jgi:hypothetical protein
VADIAPAERLHGARQAVLALRRHQQVHVVGHQHIGVHAAAIRVLRRREPVPVKRVVVLGEKDRAAVVAALDDVQRLIGEIVAAKPSHWHLRAEIVASAE